MTTDTPRGSLTRRTLAIGTATAGLALAALPVLRAQTVQIEYWPYLFREN